MSVLPDPEGRFFPTPGRSGRIDKEEIQERFPPSLEVSGGGKSPPPLPGVGIELPVRGVWWQNSSKEEDLRGGLPGQRIEIRKEFLQGESPYISASRSLALVPDLEGSW